MEFYLNRMGQVCAWIEGLEAWPHGLMIEVGGRDIDCHELTVMGKTMDWCVSDDPPSRRDKFRPIEAAMVTPLAMMAIGVVLGLEGGVSREK